MLEDGLVVPGKYIAKGPKKRLEVLKNKLDKRAIGGGAYLKIHALKGELI